MPRPVRAGQGVFPFGDLEAPADEESLEAVRASAGVADEQDALLVLFRQTVPAAQWRVSSYSSPYARATAEGGEWAGRHLRRGARGAGWS